MLIIGWAAWSIAWGATEAERLMWAGRLEQALPVARREAEVSPANLDAQERYIDLLSTLGLATTATVVYRARVEQHPGDADAMYLLGRAIPDPSLSEQAYRVCLQIEPEHARCHLGIAAVQASRGKFTDAEQEYAVAVGTDPSLAEGWSGLARTRIALGKPEAAAAAARSGLANVPGVADSYLILAVLVPQEAPSLLAEAAQRVSDDPRVHAARADDHLKRGEGGPALAAANAALAIDPGHGAAALSALFAADLVAGRLDVAGYRELVAWKAKEGSDRAGSSSAYAGLAARYPRSALPRLAQARVALAAGQRDAAVQYLRSAVDVDSTNTEARVALGLQLRAAGRAVEALPVLERAVGERRRDVSLLIALASVEAATGNLARAVTRLEGAEREWPHDARIPLEHARVYAEVAKNEEAYRVLSAAVARVPDVRLAVSLVAAAVATKRNEEAARLADDVARRTGETRWSEIAAKLRALPPQ